MWTLLMPLIVFEAVCIVAAVGYIVDTNSRKVRP